MCLPWKIHFTFSGMSTLAKVSLAASIVIATGIIAGVHYKKKSDQAVSIEEEVRCRFKALPLRECGPKPAVAGWIFLKCRGGGGGGGGGRRVEERERERKRSMANPSSMEKIYILFCIAYIVLPHQCGTDLYP